MAASCLFVSALAACGGDSEGKAASDAGEPLDAAADGGSPATDSSTSGSTDGSRLGDADAGGSDGAGSDAASTLDAGGDAQSAYPATHPAPPRCVTSGGPVLASPELVPVYYSGDDPTYASQLVDFTTNIGMTGYWAAMNEYGVGPATATTPVVVPSAAPAAIDDVAIQSLIVSLANSGGADANKLYVIYLPAGTTVTKDGRTSCTDFGAYHYEATLTDGSPVAYAVVPRCAALGSLTGIDATTAAASRALVGGSADPYPYSNPAYLTVDAAHADWSAIPGGGGEPADICAALPGATATFADFEYTVQRFWSNAQASAGAEWCVPALPGEVYFNAAPVLPDTTTIQGEVAGGVVENVTVASVWIAAGESTTIGVDLFSDGPEPDGGAWSVTAMGLDELHGTSSPALAFRFDRTTGANGVVLELTITNQALNSQEMPFFVVSSLGGSTDPSAQHWWMGLAAGTGGSTSGGSSSGGSGSGSSSGGSSSGSSSGGLSFTSLYVGTQYDYPVPVGFTSDGYLLFSDQFDSPTENETSYDVVPSSGGNVTVLVSNVPSSSSMVVSGRDAFYFPGGGGPLSFWTSSTPLKSVGTSPVQNAVAANAEGDFFYLDNVVGLGVGVVENLFVAKNDGTGATRVVQHAYRESCTLQAYWVGTSLAAQYCLQEITDGGSALGQPPTLSVFSNLFSGSNGTSFNTSTLASLLSPDPTLVSYAVSADGTTLYAPLQSGKGATVSAATVTTEATFAAGAGRGFFTGTSDSTVFFQANDTLAQVTGATSASPVVTPIVSAGVAGLYALSADGQHAMYFTTGQPGASDVWLTSTSTPGTATLLSAGGAGTPSGSDIASSLGVSSANDFTSDSGFALFASSTYEDTTGTRRLITLAASPLSSGDAGAPIQLGTNVVQVLPGAGSTVFFCANYAPGSAATAPGPLCDLYMIHLATDATPTLLMREVSPGIALTPDGTEVAFAPNDPGPLGISLGPLH